MRRFLRWCVVMVFLCPGTASAQLNAGVPLEFDFLNPGARNLALAGVAAGLADDATAVLTNPAGLPILARPEISVEFRSKRVSTDFLSGGTLGGTLNYSTFDDTNIGLNFLSVVIPVGRVAFGAYRQELARIEIDGRRDAIRAGPTLFAAVDFNREIDITTYGASVGVNLGSKFAVGAGVNVAQFETATTIPVSSLGASGDATGIGAIVGIHVTPVPKVRFGVSYRRGADIEPELNLPQAQTRAAGAKIPDIFSAGVTVRPNDQFLIAVDVSRVRYSDLQPLYEIDEEQALLELEDGTEFHAGAEYVFTGSSVQPALRFGFWYDPAHAPIFGGATQTGVPLSTDRRQLLEAIYVRPDDTMHVTGGIGLVPRSGFEVHAGVDLSSRTKLFSTSLIIRF